MIIEGLLIIPSCLFLRIRKSAICMQRAPPLDWWINNVVMLRFPLPAALSRPPYFLTVSSFPFLFFPFQTNLTPKSPNWRKASVAAAHHATAFFSPWRCCSCPPSFCPSDGRREWHFTHSWTSSSKGLRIHRVVDVRAGGRTGEGAKRSRHWIKLSLSWT